MFKVVPDQLKVSQGWVRCGHCSEVFDAQAHLQAALPPDADGVMPQFVPVDGGDQPGETQERSWHEASGQPVPQAGHADVAEQVTGEIAAPPHSDWPSPHHSSPPSLNDHASPQAWVPDEIPLDSREEPGDRYVIEEAPRMEMPIAARANPLDDAFAAPLPVAAGDAMSGPAGLTAEADAAEGLSDLGFVRQAQRKAWWARPAVRALLAFLVLTLLLLLGLQVVVQERDQIAAQMPQARGALQALCGTLGCRVSPLRQIDAIQIDSSTFNKARADSYRLVFVIRNSAAVTLATPAMELTLTDSQDQPVLRRVLLPSELTGAPAVLAAGAEWPANLMLAVDAGLPRVSGYRLMAFYP